MKTEFLLDAIGLIDDHLIEEAGEDRPGRRRVSDSWQRGLAAAACLFLAFCLTTFPLWGTGGGRKDAASTGDSGANGSMPGFAADSSDGGAAPEAEAVPGENQHTGCDGGVDQKGEQELGSGTDGDMQLSGESRLPILWWQGQAYACILLDNAPEDMSMWSELGELQGSSTEEGALEDLWLHADFEATGAVYSSEAYPDVLLAEISVEKSGEIRWVQFVLQLKQET